MLRKKEISMIVIPILIGITVSSFQFGKNAAAQSNNARQAFTGPIKINTSSGKPMFAIFSSATKGTVLRFYDKDGNAIIDLSSIDNPIGVTKALSVSAPSADEP